MPRKSTSLIQIIKRKARSAKPRRTRVPRAAAGVRASTAPPPVVIASTTNVNLPPGPTHGVSGFPVTGIPNDFGFYTPAGLLYPTTNIAGSRYGVQNHLPQSVNTFTPSTHTPAPITPIPNPAMNTSESALPLRAGAGLAFAPPSVPQSYVGSRFASGYLQDDPVTASLHQQGGGAAPQNLNPSTNPSQVTPTNPFYTPPRAGGHLHDQGTFNLFEGTRRGPLTGNDQANLAAPNTPQLINTSNASTNTDPVHVRPPMQAHERRAFDDLIGAISAQLNPMPPPPSAPIFPRQGGTGTLASTSGGGGAARMLFYDGGDY